MTNSISNQVCLEKLVITLWVIIGLKNNTFLNIKTPSHYITPGHGQSGLIRLFLQTEVLDPIFTIAQYY